MHTPFALSVSMQSSVGEANGNCECTAISLRKFTTVAGVLLRAVSAAAEGSERHYMIRRADNPSVVEPLSLHSAPNDIPERGMSCPPAHCEKNEAPRF
jgi:hypothetical protein